ncbi:PREDICTED: biogenesis of lysosome-related organelles complex 1 subunit 5-like isoform X4 [Rhagoletis zephyria]|uniref:biogenesis of lysosome-related organelles complex 1 subunit 5-like isoform X4 n=1 Tax=Rhagoletis zephyria TaxID=28612 RepID=UPI0008115E11|nr:PREDICTED: biogenesis of lysosome-related organelles complex 1 subunit 5-like isoform X4 [Rhagoletis zephyria]
MLRLLGRDILNAQLRILDHRSFTNGEVNNFLNEFELKRNECEVENLFKVTEITGDLKYDLFGRCDILSTRHLGQLNREVNDVLLGVEEFLNKVQSGKKLLYKQRSSLGRQWQTSGCISAMNNSFS